MGARAPDFKPGEMLPGTKYRIVNQIGAGGMGVVYQVVKAPSIQGVLKLMSRDLTGHEEFRTRFLDEVRVLAQLDHPNIVKVFDYDSLTDGTPFYVMELLHGRTVRDVLATMGRISPRVAFEITRQLCEALHCAHTHDIPVVHRDIKPENIFLHAPRHGEPVVKLIDFGVIAVADRQHDGAFVGTWKYAAPEQIRGERATPATDLYAVGLVLYEMLCGFGPFDDLEAGTLVSEAHLHELPPPISKFAPWVPASVVELMDAALRKESRDRPRDAHVFAGSLYDLEWANDGKDPSPTAEGPLSRILSSVGAAKPSSKKMVVAAARDQLGDVPAIGIPPDSRHGGPTLRGVGGQPHEPTSPGEDALLAGLLGRIDVTPLSKKARESGPSLDGDKVVIRPRKGEHIVQVEATPRMPLAVHRVGIVAKLEAPTLDAPPSEPQLPVASAADASAAERTTLKRAVRSVDTDTDTFSSQESDARRSTRPRGGKLLVPIAIAAIALIGVGTFAVLWRPAPAPAAVAQPSSPPRETGAAVGMTAVGVLETAVPTATPPTRASAASAASTSAASAASTSAASATSTSATSAASATNATSAAHAAQAPDPSIARGTKKPPAPKSSKPDQSFTHTF